jgi:hypothetical protein
MFITGAGFPTQKQFGMKEEFHQLCPEKYNCKSQRRYVV